MNCARCNKPALVLFPGGYCGKCNAILSAPVAFHPSKRKQVRKGSPRCCEPSDRCQQCGGVKEPMKNEPRSIYLRRRYCAAPRTCYRDAQRERAYEHQPWNGNKKPKDDTAVGLAPGVMDDFRKGGF